LNFYWSTLQFVPNHIVVQKCCEVLVVIKTSIIHTLLAGQPLSQPKQGGCHATNISGYLSYRLVDRRGTRAPKRGRAMGAGAPLRQAAWHAGGATAWPGVPLVQTARRLPLVYAVKVELDADRALDRSAARGEEGLKQR